MTAARGKAVRDEHDTPARSGRGAAPVRAAPPAGHRLSAAGSIGRLSDVIVRLRGADYPVVTGLVATVGGRAVFVPSRAGRRSLRGRCG